MPRTLVHQRATVLCRQPGLEERIYLRMGGGRLRLTAAIAIVVATASLAGLRQANGPRGSSASLVTPAEPTADALGLVGKWHATRAERLGSPAGPALRIGTHSDAAGDGSSIKLVFSRGPTYEVVAERLWLLSGPRHAQTPLPVAKRSADTEPSWSPNGRRIAFTRTLRRGEDDWPASLWVMRADGRGGHLVAADQDWWVAHLEPDWSSDGVWIAFRSELPSPTIATAVKLVHPDGTGGIQLISPGGAPDWSPDGSAITFVRWESPDIIWGGARDIYRAAADGSGIKNLTNDPADDFDPTWSPDGTRIAFVSDRSGNPDIWIMRGHGTSPVQLTRNSAPDRDPTWSPNGKRLAFTSSRVAEDPFAYNASTDIFVIDADGTNLRRLTWNPAIEADPDWQPSAAN